MIDITRIDKIIVSNAPPRVYLTTTIILRGFARAHGMVLSPLKVRVIAHTSPSYKPNSQILLVVSVRKLPCSSSVMNVFVCSYKMNDESEIW